VGRKRAPLLIGWVRAVGGEHCRGEVSTLSRWVSEFAGSRVGEGQYQGIGVFLAL